MPRRTFDLPTPTREDPPVFEMAYKRTLPDGEVVQMIDEYECLPWLPAAALRYMGQAASNTLAAIAYIERCIASDDDALKFLMLIDDRSVALGGKELGDVFEWLVAQYADDRPTGTPGPSPSGQAPIGPTSPDEQPRPE